METAGPGRGDSGRVPEGKGRSLQRTAVGLAAIALLLGGLVAILALPAPLGPASNAPPTLHSVAANRGAADIAQPVVFTANATDPDGDPLTYEWDFGDNSTSTGESVTHVYGVSGRYIVVVTVADVLGHTVDSETSPLFIIVNQAERAKPMGSSYQPNPVTLLAANRSFVPVNETVAFSGNSSWTWAWDAFVGRDKDGDGVPDAPVGWTYQPAATNRTAVTVLSYDFGDGAAPVSGPPTSVGSVAHRFTIEGSHFVRLSVTNYLGKSDTAGYTVRVSASAGPTGAVKDPTIFTKVSFGEPASLDPAFDHTSPGTEVIQNVAETLIWYDGARADRFVPQLAAKVPDVANLADVSPDGRSYNFTLRPGLTFHSGNAVTCAAVRFSIQRVLTLADPRSPAWILDQSLTGYAVDDPLTLQNERTEAINASVSCTGGDTGLRVRFDLATPYQGFLATLADTVASVIDPDPNAYRVTELCPANSVTGKPNLMASYCHDQLIGTGAFKLRFWQPNLQVILDRNLNYWRSVVTFEEVHLLRAYDPTTRVLMLKAGDADGVLLEPEHRDDIRDAQGVLLTGITEYTTTGFALSFLGFNRDINVTSVSWTEADVPADFFADVSVRKAFAHVWQYDDYITEVAPARGTRICGPIPQGMFGYFAEGPCYGHDPARAEQYLRLAADRRPGKSGTYWDNGFNLTLYHELGNVAQEAGARRLATTLGALNSKFEVTAIGLEGAMFQEYVRRRIVPLAFFDWFPDYADPDNYVTSILRTGKPVPNWVGYSNGTLDRKIDQQAVEIDPGARLQLLIEIQAAAYFDVPYIWTVQWNRVDVLRSWIIGFYGNPMHGGNYYYALSKA